MPNLSLAVLAGLKFQACGTEINFFSSTAKLQEGTFKATQAQFTLIWETLGQTISSLLCELGVWGIYKGDSRQKRNNNCIVFQQVWVESCASLGSSTCHVFWGVFRNRKLFQYFVLPMNSRGLRQKKKKIFLRIWFSNSDKKCIENSLKLSVKTWCWLHHIHLCKQQTQLHQGSPTKLRAGHGMITHVPWGLITVWSYSEGSTKTRAQALQTSHKHLHEMLNISAVWQREWKIPSKAISPKWWFIEQTPDVIVTELRQLISGTNAMKLLGLGDVCLSKSGGSSFPEEPQNTHLSSWLHGLGQHGKIIFPLKVVE